METISLIKNRLVSDRPVLLPRTLIKEKKLAIFSIRSMYDLAPGAYGILEPVEARAERVDPAKIDVVLVPGSVFDYRGGRFGYGGGFYDRFLSRDAPRAVRIGLAFSFQVLDNIPIKPHDELMDYIITERQVISCRTGLRR